MKRWAVAVIQIDSSLSSDNESTSLDPDPCGQVACCA